MTNYNLQDFNHLCAWLQFRKLKTVLLCISDSEHLLKAFWHTHNYPRISLKSQIHDISLPVALTKVTATIWIQNFQVYVMTMSSRSRPEYVDWKTLRMTSLYFDSLVWMLQFSFVIFLGVVCFKNILIFNKFGNEPEMETKWATCYFMQTLPSNSKQKHLN